LTVLLTGLIAGDRALASTRARAGVMWGALAGLLGGALFLAVPPVGLLLVGIALGVVAVRRSAAYVLGFALVIGALLPIAWAIRNYEAMHAFVPVSTNTGLNLLIGNSEHSTPSSGLTADVTPYMNYVKSHHLGEVQANNYYERAAFTWVLNHPLREVALYAGKAAYDFAPTNRLHTTGESAPGTAVVSAVTYLPFLALFLVRLLLWVTRSRRMSRWEVLLVAIVIGNALVQAISMTRVRYRVPTDPFMIAVGLSLLISWVAARHRPLQAVAAPRLSAPSEPASPPAPVETS
jgi:hypothetical protein